MENNSNVPAVNDFFTADYYSANYRGNSYRSFYIDLRDAMYRELTQTGSCTQIDNMLMPPPATRYRPAKLLMFPYAAMVDVLQAVDSEHSLPPVNKQIFRFGTTQYCWRQFDPSKDPMQWTCTIASDLSDLKSCYQRIKNRHGASASAQTDYQCAVACAPQNETGNRVIKSNADAEKEPAQIRIAAQREAEKIRREAREEADQLRLNTQREAEQLRNDAREEAEKIRREAREKATREIRDESDRLIQQNLQGYIQEQRRIWAEEQTQTADEVAQTALDVVKLKDDVNTESKSLGVSFNQNLNQILRQLEDLKADMFTSLQKWRTSLYQCEYGSLISFYTLLTGISEYFQRDALAAQTTELTAQQTRDTIVQHSISLSKLCTNLIRAMEKMGIQQFSPQPGDRFDSLYHTVNDDENDDIYLDRVIERCEQPGIERIVNSQETTVLLRATVTLRPSQDS